MLLADAAEGEQIAQQGIHELCRFVDAIGAVFTGFAQSCASLLDEQRRKTLHGPQRRAQVMSDRIDKSFQLRVRGAQFRGALGDESFELPGAVSQLRLGAVQGFLGEFALHDFDAQL